MIQVPKTWDSYLNAIKDDTYEDVRDAHYLIPWYLAYEGMTGASHSQRWKQLTQIQKRKNHTFGDHSRKKKIERSDALLHIPKKLHTVGNREERQFTATKIVKRVLYWRGTRTITPNHATPRHLYSRLQNNNIDEKTVLSNPLKSESDQIPSNFDFAQNRIGAPGTRERKRKTHRLMRQRASCTCELGVKATASPPKDSLLVNPSFLKEQWHPQLYWHHVEIPSRYVHRELCF